MSERSKRRIDHEDEVPYTPTGDGVRSPDTKRRKKTSKPSGLKPDNEFIRNQLVGKERLLAQIAEIYRPLLVGEYVKNPEMEACECDRLISVIMSKHAPSIGDVYIAGNNESSQLGMSRETGTGSSRFLLSTQLKGSEIVQIAASSQSCYVLSRDGTLCDWGNSDTGALGRRTNMDDDEDDERLAKQITGFIPSKKSIVKVSASSEDSNLLQVAAGNSHGIALSDSGSVYSWGGYITDNKPWRNSAPPDRPDKDTVDSELYKGAAPKGFREEPRHVHDMPQKVFSITAGQGMSVAILMDGTAVTWGIDTCGELGRGITKEARHIFLHADTDEEKEERNQIVLNQLVKPLPVIFSPPIGKHVVWNISCGQSHMLMVVKKDGETYTDVYGTGLNQYGQLGLGHTESQNCLTKIPDSEKLFIGQVAAGQHHSIFLDTYGELLYTCGRSDSGQLGITDQVPPPGEMKTTLQLVEFDEDLDAEDKVIRRIAAGEDHSLAVTATGKLFSWGFGDEGQLGRKAEKYQPRPTLVTQYGKGDSVFVMDASAGTHHTMVLCGRNPTNENN